MLRESERTCRFVINAQLKTVCICFSEMLKFIGNRQVEKDGTWINMLFIFAGFE